MGTVVSVRGVLARRWAAAVAGAAGVGRSFPRHSPASAASPPHTSTCKGRLSPHVRPARLFRVGQVLVLAKGLPNLIAHRGRVAAVLRGGRGIGGGMSRAGMAGVSTQEPQLQAQAGHTRAPCGVPAKPIILPWAVGLPGTLPCSPAAPCPRSNPPCAGNLGRAGNWDGNSMAMQCMVMAAWIRPPARRRCPATCMPAAPWSR